MIKVEYKRRVAKVRSVSGNGQTKFGHKNEARSIHTIEASNDRRISDNTVCGSPSTLKS